MFRPPLARGMMNLDRSVFQRLIPTKAARVFDNKNISVVRSKLERSKDSLQLERLQNIQPDPDSQKAQAGLKCVLLRPSITSNERTMSTDVDDAATNGNSTDAQRPYSPVLNELVDQGLIAVTPYQLHLTYDYWNYHEIIGSVLPEELHSEIPSGFSHVGHVAHLNLRDEYLPYKHIIAAIIQDKNPTVSTVINKIDDVGEENEFRTFKYEVLAGPDDLNVTVSEEGCTFKFDYAKVYWNSRLHTEHSRLVHSFAEGDAVCDVMAGIGPFAVPAGKRGCFVWANDLNPDSYASLEDAVKRNKVQQYVRPFNTDGRVFIRDAAAQLLDDEREVQILKKTSRKEPNAKPEVLKTIRQPRTFHHFVLNLPASAITFLSSFVGLYADPDVRVKLPPATPLPLVHVYCFNQKDEQEAKRREAGSEETENKGAVDSICAEISRQIGFEMKEGKVDDKEGNVEVWDVRDVAPNKRMFCATFRIPTEVAFRVVS